MHVNVLDAKTNLSRLLALAEAGEEVVITRAGVPCVRLVPVRKARTRDLATLLAELEADGMLASRAVPPPAYMGQHGRDDFDAVVADCERSRND